MKRLLPGLLLIGALVVAGCVAVPVREELASAGGGSLSTTGTLTVGTFFNTTKGSTVTVTNGSTITLTTSFTPITAAGAVATATLLGCTTAGRINMLYNTAAQTITLTDTSTLMLAGNYGMTQYDTLTLIGDGTNCIELARAVN
jgi:predicted lipoprotein with Yx(FWY)xxD motif